MYVDFVLLYFNGFLYIVPSGAIVTLSSMNGSPTLNVSWTGPTGSGITYIVKYSTTNQASPPQDARNITTSTSPVTLIDGIQQGTTYYVWVAAIKNGLQGSYSIRRSARSFSGILKQFLCLNSPLKVSCFL